MKHFLTGEFWICLVSSFVMTVTLLKLNAKKIQPNVIREPLTGPPPGFVHGGAMFTQKDGKFTYGCVNPDSILRHGVKVERRGRGEKIDICIALNVAQPHVENEATVQ